MTGAQVFARACREEGVAALFCCPGNYGVIHAIANLGIPTYSGRHEGAMTHAADAFIRVTGEVAVASGTEGPGFTDMICGIACANAARTPLLVVASNMALFQEDTEAGIQLAYQQPTTDGMKKYGKRLVTPGRVHEYTAYAFRQLRSGVPRPVHLDFPAEVASARFKDASELSYYFDRAKYRTESWPHPSSKQIDLAVAMLKAAERPIIVSSNGVFYRRGWDALKRLAEKAQIPVVESGAMKGQFSDAHPLSANAAPTALASADVVVLVGQHCMPTIGEFAFGPDARYIRIDQAHEDIGRNLPIELGIVSCEKAALEALADAMPTVRHEAWVAEIAAARDKFEAQNDEFYKIGASYTDALHPAVIAKELADFLYRGSIPREQVTVASGGYGIARYTRRWLRGYRPGQIMNGAYQYGAIGPDVGYALGVAAAVQQGVGPQAAVQGQSDCLHHRRRGLWLHRDGDGNSEQIPATGGRAGVQQQRVGHLDDGPGRKGPATASFSGERPIRQGGRGPRRPRRIRHQAGGFPARARAGVAGCGHGTPAVGDQLPGQEGVLASRQVSTGDARQDRAWVHVVLPLRAGSLRSTVPGLRSTECRPRSLVLP